MTNRVEWPDKYIFANTIAVGVVDVSWTQQHKQPVDSFFLKLSWTGVIINDIWIMSER